MGERDCRVYPSTRVRVGVKVRVRFGMRMRLSVRRREREGKGEVGCEAEGEGEGECKGEVGCEGVRGTVQRDWALGLATIKSDERMFNKTAVTAWAKETAECIPQHG